MPKLIQSIAFVLLLCSFTFDSLKYYLPDCEDLTEITDIDTENELENELEDELKEKSLFNTNLDICSMGILLSNEKVSSFNFFLYAKFKNSPSTPPPDTV